jgi:PhzF family phenazine biosynthesis protein
MMNDMMNVERIAAFTQGNRGGNPAGVVICVILPDASTMQALAAEIGYSETVFAAPSATGYRVRYFAPDIEIPFCGHATIALAASLARRGRTEPVILELNHGSIVVEGRDDFGMLSATLMSPPTRNEPAPLVLLDNARLLFALTDADLDPGLPPAMIEAGARHLLLALRKRDRLAAMRYDMVRGAALMKEWELATISLVQAESPSRYHARNPFAAGGVYEDPATGAAAAALVGYLQHLGIVGTEEIVVLQGEDMGQPCLLRAKASGEPGGGARVRGTARMLDPVP